MAAATHFSQLFKKRSDRTKCISCFEVGVSVELHTVPKISLGVALDLYSPTTTKKRVVPIRFVSRYNTYNITLRLKQQSISYCCMILYVSYTVVF